MPTTKASPQLSDDRKELPTSWGNIKCQTGKEKQTAVHTFRQQQHVMGVTTCSAGRQPLWRFSTNQRFVDVHTHFVLLGDKPYALQTFRDSRRDIATVSLTEAMTGDVYWTSPVLTRPVRINASSVGALIEGNNGGAPVAIKLMPGPNGPVAYRIGRQDAHVEPIFPKRTPPLQHAERFANMPVLDSSAQVCTDISPTDQDIRHILHCAVGQGNWRYEITSQLPKSRLAANADMIFVARFARSNPVAVISAFDSRTGFLRWTRVLYGFGDSSPAPFYTELSVETRGNVVLVRAAGPSGRFIELFESRTGQRYGYKSH